MKTSDNTFIDYFINAITAENGISYNTQIAYRNDLIGFLKFLKNNQSKDQIQATKNLGIIFFKEFGQVRSKLT